MHACGMCYFDFVSPLLHWWCAGGGLSQGCVATCLVGIDYSFMALFLF